MKLSKGIKSSEFWVALATAVIPILNSTFGWGIPMEATLGLIAYILGRSAVKVKTNDAEH
jgi:hypothetical protein